MLEALLISHLRDSWPATALAGQELVKCHALVQREEVDILTRSILLRW